MRKKVSIRRFSSLYFFASGLNTEMWKIRNRKTPSTDTFHALLHITQYLFALKFALKIKSTFENHVFMADGECESS